MSNELNRMKELAGLNNSITENNISRKSTHLLLDAIDAGEITSDVVLIPLLDYMSDSEVDDFIDNEFAWLKDDFYGE